MGIRPVPESFPITQTFHQDLTQYNVANAHGAVDFGTPEGVDIVAMDDGVVLHADYAWNLPATSWEDRWFQIRPAKGDLRSGGGVGTVIYHEAQGYTSLTWHMRRTDLNKGDRVKQGQKIGESGNTGSSTGPHTHVAVLPIPYRFGNGYFGGVDPLPYMRGKYFKLNTYVAPDRSGATMDGIDISNWQVGINLAAVPADFVIVLATDGAGFTNPHLAAQVEQALRLGKRVGVYHFARVTGSANSDVEARHFLSKVKRWKGKVIPVLDWEPPGYSHRTDYADAWMRRVEAEFGHECLLYMNLSTSRLATWSAYAKSHDLWLASYALGAPDFIGYAQTFQKPSTPGWKLVLWQYSDRGRLPGYAGHLDLNVAFGDPWKRPTGYGTATETGDWFSMASKADLDKVVRAALDRHWYYKRDTLGAASRETVSYDEQMRWLNADIRTLNAKLDALVDAVGVLLDEKKEGAE